MLRTLFTACCAMVLFGIAAPVMADSACGGEVQYSGDLANSKKAWAFSCCPDGYRVHGVACADLPPDQDYADGCSAVCRSISKGDIMKVSSDFQRQPTQYQCKKTEVMAGIYCEDVSDHGGGENSDVSDGCTAICQDPKSSALRRVPNFDLSGKKQGSEITVLLPKRVVGIACKEINKGSSDRLDGCTIVVK